MELTTLKSKCLHIALVWKWLFCQGNTSPLVCTCIPVYQLVALPERQWNSCHLCMNGIDFLWSCLFHNERLVVECLSATFTNTHNFTRWWESKWIYSLYGLPWTALLNWVVQGTYTTQTFPLLGLWFWWIGCIGDERTGKLDHKSFWLLLGGYFPIDVVKLWQCWWKLGLLLWPLHTLRMVCIRVKYTLRKILTKVFTIYYFLHFKEYFWGCIGSIFNYIFYCHQRNVLSTNLVNKILRSNAKWMYVCAHHENTCHWQCLQGQTQALLRSRHTAFIHTLVWQRMPLKNRQVRRCCPCHVMMPQIRRGYVPASGCVTDSLWWTAAPLWDYCLIQWCCPIDDA